MFRFCARRPSIRESSFCLSAPPRASCVFERRLVSVSCVFVVVVVVLLLSELLGIAEVVLGRW